MKGCRPLTTEEIKQVKEQFIGTYEVRNKAMFLLGVSTGGRISELLSLKIDDVWQNGSPVSDLLFEKNIVKGKKTSRMIPVNEDGQKAIRELIHFYRTENACKLNPKQLLFKSREGDNKAISRTQGHRVLKDAFKKAGLNGKVATHTLRKTYAQRLYDATDDIYLVKEALGHKSVDTTQQYLGISYSKFQRASETIEINRTVKTLHSVSEASLEELIIELQKRGMDTKELIEQLRADKKQDDVIQFPIVA